MPTDIKLINARDFVKATSYGELDFETSKKALTEIASAAAHLVDYEILLDIRKAQVRMSPINLWYLAAELSKLDNAFSRKTAVLCPVEQFDAAAFFALCSKNRSLNVEAFTSFEEAINWLVELELDT
jgi:hypothetical protein